MLRHCTFYFSISMPVFIIDKKTLYISGTSSANVSLVVSFKLLFALMYILFYTCTRSPLAKPLIFNASNQIKTFRLYMAGLCKATLCVLDAEIWIIRVLRVFFKEETRCELKADFSASYLFLSLFENRWQQLYVLHTKKKDHLHSESLLNVILRRLLYKVRCGCGQFYFPLGHFFQHYYISKILVREKRRLPKWNFR